jgi:hypothetical protein
MEIRNAQNAVQVRYHCFAAACGVLMLNLQPEAGSEEFVRSSQLKVALGQLLAAVSCELVWTSVPQ